ncbi:MAG: helix-turn-helix transcriptional regulator, partial [Thermoplasmata archaeon]|nr:helix-turn-helix transcriptional regulator [Thermoplasmata archaeon]
MREVSISSAGIHHALLDIMSRVQTPRILVHLFREPNTTASETAASLGIHIATAQKYLEGLERAGVVESRERPSKPRTAKEYHLLDTKISIEFDIEKMAAEAEREKRPPDLSEIMIREKSRSDVAYEWDDAGKRITAVMFFRKGLRRRMERKVILSKEEGRFLWHVPFQSEEFRSAGEVMEMAGLGMDGGKAMKIIGRFEKLGIVMVENGGPGHE